MYKYSHSILDKPFFILEPRLQILIFKSRGKQKSSKTREFIVQSRAVGNSTNTKASFRESMLLSLLQRSGHKQKTVAD